MNSRAIFAVVFDEAVEVVLLHPIACTKRVEESASVSILQLHFGPKLGACGGGTAVRDFEKGFYAAVHVHVPPM